MIEEEMETADRSMMQAIKGLNAEVGETGDSGRTEENPHKREIRNSNLT